jgi:hypothetical protein
MARPEAKVDKDQVLKLASIGCTTEEIASVCKVSKDTIERRFAALLEKGRLNFKSSIRRMQYSSGNGGNVTMQIWLGKQYLGQKDQMEVDPGDGFRQFFQAIKGAE